MVSFRSSAIAGRDLGVHHQITAVADHHDHIAVRTRQLDTQPARNLVAHARVAVLEVISVTILSAPQFVQLAWQTTGGADHGAVRSDGAVDGAKHLRVAG